MASRYNKSYLALRVIRANDWWEDFWTQQAATHAPVA
jgi:hypothetical protein